MDFYDEEMLQRLVELLKSNAIKKGDIRLEITETSYAAPESDREKILEEFHLSGAKILLDDFGSGFSSFGMLKRYNFDILKLDIPSPARSRPAPRSAPLSTALSRWSTTWALRSLPRVRRRKLR